MTDPSAWLQAPPAAEVRRRLAEARGRLAAAGAGDRLRVVVVTKGFGPDAIVAAVDAGLADIGENYPQELRAKAAALGTATGAGAGAGAGAPRPTPGAGAAAGGACGASGGTAAKGACGASGGTAAGEGALDGRLRWHFLGAVQRRQVRLLAPLVALWHGVCRVEEGEAIAAAAPGARVLVQVAPPGHPERRGVALERVTDVVGALSRAGVKPVGLMVVGLPGDRHATAGAFAAVAAEGHRLGLPELSMGMSDDADLAVAAGATMVRLGRALLGERPVQARAGQATDFHPPSGHRR